MFLRHLRHRGVSFCTAANGLEEHRPAADKKAAKLKKKPKKQLEVQPEEATTDATPLKKKKKKRKLGDATEPPGRRMSNHERLLIRPRVTHKL